MGQIFPALPPYSRNNKKMKAIIPVLFLISINGVQSLPRNDDRPDKISCGVNEPDENDISINSRSAVPNYGRWPGNRIPFKIANGFSPDGRDKIQRAMNLYATKTCIRFVEAGPQDKMWITITQMEGKGCYSDIGYYPQGRPGGKHTVYLPLSSRCQNVGSIFHELMHTVGFYHEHQRPDRDQFVTILRQNIQRGNEHDFEIKREGEVQKIGGYDYYSIMQYPPDFRARQPGLNTMQTKDPKYQSIIGRFKGDLEGGVSSKDIQKINQLYQCKQG